VVEQTFVLRVNICGENRQLLLAAKRQAKKTLSIEKNKMKEKQQHKNESN